MDKTLRTILAEETKKNVVWNGVFGVYAVNLDSRKEAEKIANCSKIKKYFETEIVEKSGRFFLNFSPKEDVLTDVCTDVRTKKKLNFGKGKVQIEFISANPTGELHIGHGRDAFYGDVLANVLEFSGYDVECEYYINDAKESTQIKELGKTVLGVGDSYSSTNLDDYMSEKIGKIVTETKKRKEIISETKKEEWNYGKIGYMVAENIQKDNKKFIEEELKIKFDNWFSEEKELYEKGKIEDTLKILRDKSLYYEKDGATWMKTSKYGDNEDRVLMRSDGTPSYFLADIAYHINKFEKRKFDKVINIWGADHQGHVKRMMAVKKALDWNGELKILIGQLVALKEGGKRKRLSKRKGDVIWLKDLVKDVGLDVARWFFLEKGISSHTEFDLDLAKEQSKKNPVYYVQYAHARMCSILAKSEIQNPKFETNSKFKILNSKFEKGLILKLVRFPEIIEEISKDYQVHHLTTYIYELAKTFTDFYENVRVLDAETEDLKEARLVLVFTARQILGKGLSLMGISVPERM